MRNEGRSGSPEHSRGEPVVRASELLQEYVPSCTGILCCCFRKSHSLILKRGAEALRPLWTLDPLLTILSLTTTGQYLYWKIETCTSFVNHRGTGRRGGSGETEEYINEMNFAIDVCLCFECSRRLFYLNVLKPVCLSIFHALVAMVHK